MVKIGDRVTTCGGRIGTIIADSASLEPGDKEAQHYWIIRLIHDHGAYLESDSLDRFTPAYISTVVVHKSNIQERHVIRDG